MSITKGNHYKFDRLLELLIPLLVIIQVHTSILWYNTPIIASFLVLIIFVLSYIGKGKIYLPNSTSILAFLFSLFIFVVIHFQGSSVVTLLAFLSVFLVDDKVKLKALKNLTMFLSVMIAITLPLWMIHVNGIYTFPLYRLLDLSFLGTNAYLEDYLFFIYDPKLLFPRYYCIFEEPGIFALLLSFVLIANKFDFKYKNNIVLLLGLIFTFSLTGYAVATMSFILIKIRNFSSLLKVTLMICFVIFVLSSYFEETFTQLIIDRITNMEERGINNRTEDSLNKFYDLYVFTQDAIIGKGYRFVSDKFTGDSYKIFVISYGYLGLISIFLIWYSIYRCYKKEAVIILIAYIVAFLPLSAVYISWRLMLFSIACASLSNVNK